MPLREQDIVRVLDISLEEAYSGTSRIVRLNGQRMEVKIPPGVRTGTRVRVRSRGNLAHGRDKSGDFYLKVEVRLHDLFDLDGDDLHCDVAVGLYEAILGGEVLIPTLGGSLKLKIPPGTQNGRVFRIKGQGMPHLHEAGAYGYLFARIQVRLPEDLTDDELDLFEALRDLRANDDSLDFTQT
jgi:curved DNA-binding protein